MREKREDKRETGETPAVWYLQQRMPISWRKPIRVYLAQEDLDLTEFVAEAIREYAEKCGITLTPRNDLSAWAS